MKTSAVSRAVGALGKLAVASAVVLLAASIALLLDVLRPVGRPDARLGAPAPEWDVAEWVNANPGSLAELRGQVVVVEFFQMLCKGCDEFGLPLMRRLEREYADRDDVRFVMIHSVFAHHDRQTPERLREFVELRQIGTSVGIDRHAGGKTSPETMDRYRLVGTPAFAVIDRKGVLRFRRLGRFDPALLRRYIDRCVSEAP